MITICIVYLLAMSRHVGFQNGCHLNSTFAINFGFISSIDLILVSKCMTVMNAKKIGQNQF